MTERKRFERWFLTHYFNGDEAYTKQFLEVHNSGFYVSREVAHLWESWQAAKEDAIDQNVEEYVQHHQIG